MYKLTIKKRLNVLFAGDDVATIGTYFKYSNLKNIIYLICIQSLPGLKLRYGHEAVGVSVELLEVRLRFRRLFLLLPFLL